MNRRAFLAAIAAAPVAAAVPFRGPTTWMATWHGIDFGAGPSMTAIIWRYRRDMAELCGIERELLAATTYRANGATQDVPFPNAGEGDTFVGIHDEDPDDDDDEDPDDIDDVDDPEED